MRIAIRVKPGASRTMVRGAYGEGEQARLVVAVGARAVDGAATEATLVALAEAFGLRRRQVSLVAGFTSRDKLVELDVDGTSAEASTAARLRELLC